MKIQALAVLLISVLGVAGPSAAGGREVEALLSTARLRTGLVVMAGDADPASAEALARSGRWVVQRLVPAGRVEGLRRAALAAGLHGRLQFDPLPAWWDKENPFMSESWAPSPGRRSPPRRGRCL